MNRSSARLAVVIALTGGLVAGPAIGAVAKPTKKEVRLFEIVNRAREAHGLRTLRLNKRMTRKAHQHSVGMANAGTIYHSSCLACHSPKPSFRAMGENVARAGGIKAVHRNLMRSASHRSNVLCSCYKAIGVGIVKRGGKLYVTQIFWG